MSLTPILGLTLPVVNGDENTWGTELNGDLTTLDSLGVAPPVGVASNFLMVAGSAPERVYRVTTGGMNVTGTAPDPGTIPIGKIFTVKVLDVGGSATIKCVNAAVTFDGQPNYQLANQYAFVRIYANGATYDVIGAG